ncbi:MAG TPA: hypothetical protein QGF63_05170 [Alphaproteobacteria bacterium]|jgi:hypothetical protein|nr:hypothetical protein [Alphaproteobacteria bacterium]MDP6269889.1 hypothetical protein [Alphaproteobacteria bacterium]MDP7428027.1 hypothetical protein [Alphaproteobacteria bacterium]HJM49224.1 hypothetical protein [Alphaproteobacteria bacterium]
MHDGQHSNAMTEIALALAMAFFSIMVLTMVSMGAGLQAGAAPASDAGMALKRSAGESARGRPLPSEAVLVVHYGGRFLDAEFRPLDPARITGTVVLAIAPNLTMVEAIAVRQRLAVADLTVTTLDNRWIEALKENSK